MLNKAGRNSLAEVLQIEFIEINSHYLKAHMPINSNTKQSLGFLHGGASATLAEHTGSVAAYLSLDRDKYFCFGMDLKINHLKPATDGFVIATATPVHIGIQTQVWQIQTHNEQNELIAHSTLTMANVALDSNMRKVIGKLFDEASGSEKL